MAAIDRPDFSNCKNWHWVEKNATPWSRERLTQLLLNQSLESKSLRITLTEFKKLEGDATANNRKAKLIFLYDWVVEIKFIAKAEDAELEYKGVLEIPNLSDENTADEIELNTAIETRGPLEAELRAFFAKDGLAFIRKQLGTYIRELKEEFSKGLILPTEMKPQVVTKGGKAAIFDKRSFQNNVVTDTKSSPKVANEVITSSFELAETFKVPPSRLYEILTYPELVRAWSGNSQIEAREGGTFALFGGQITGTFKSLKENERIDVLWRLRNYPPDHYASISFTLHDQSDSTKLELKASNVPKELAESTETGLQRHYFQNIGRTFACALKML